ncbi:MAG TPA: RpiR family transcriptional regulator [Clostridiales bacterium]|nr:RpiR family transcriptional regulator [Clostridiales bacterium]
MPENNRCLLLIKEIFDSLSGKEKLIASFIIDFPNEVIRLSIEDFAAACKTSVSSVIRFCKKIGCAGYKDLCRMLTADIMLSPKEISYDDTRPGDGVESIMRNVCMTNMKAIEKTMAILDVKSLEAAVEALCQAKRIDFYGVGASGIVALDSQNKFLRIYKTGIASAEAHVQILSASSLTPGDVAVIISHSGETYDILNVANIAQKTGATLISITKYGKNSLASVANINLFSSSTETMIRSGAMSSRIAQMTVIDILYTSVCSRLYDEVKPHLDKTRFVTSYMRPRITP